MKSEFLYHLIVSFVATEKNKKETLKSLNAIHLAAGILNIHAGQQ